MSTIFTQIITGEIPAYKVYEDEYICAFLDVNPMQAGHTLVVPKKEVAYFFDLDDALYDKVMHRVKYVAMILKAKLDCQKVVVVIEGYAIPHAHVHLIPTNGPDDFDKKHVHKATDDELHEMYTKLTGHEK